MGTAIKNRRMRLSQWNSIELYCKGVMVQNPVSKCHIEMSRSGSRTFVRQWSVCCILFSTCFSSYNLFYSHSSLLKVSLFLCNLLQLSLDGLGDAKMGHWDDKNRKKNRSYKKAIKLKITMQAVYIHKLQTAQAKWHSGVVSSSKVSIIWNTWSKEMASFSEISWWKDFRLWCSQNILPQHLFLQKASLLFWIVQRTHC